MGLERGFVVLCCGGRGKGKWGSRERDQSFTASWRRRFVNQRGCSVFGVSDFLPLMFPPLIIG